MKNVQVWVHIVVSCTWVGSLLLWIGLGLFWPEHVTEDSPARSDRLYVLIIPIGLIASQILQNQYAIMRKLGIMEELTKKEGEGKWEE